MGTSRDRLYAILRRHNLVAYNPVLQRYAEHNGGASPLDGGEWPRAGQRRSRSTIATSFSTSLLSGEDSIRGILTPLSSKFGTCTHRAGQYRFSGLSSMTKTKCARSTRVPRVRIAERLTARGRLVTWV
jgi:hypothetical protein